MQGITSDMARDMLADHNYFGTMMVRGGDADGMVSGAVHTTASTIRPALQASNADTALIERMHVAELSFCEIPGPTHLKSSQQNPVKKRPLGEAAVTIHGNPTLVYMVCSNVLIVVVLPDVVRWCL